MTDPPRRTQNRSRGDNYYPINKRNIGGTAMKSRHSRLPVSDMVKMYSPPNSTAIGNRTAPVARKWPPVATAASPASSKPPPTAPKPGGLSSHAVNGARPGTAPRPFQSENKPILPKWKMDIENRKAATSHNDKQEENRRPSWGQKRDEPEEKKHETVPPWNQRQKQQDNAEVSRPKWGQQRNEQKEEESNLPAWKLELLRAKQETEKASENALKSTSHEDSNSTRSVSNGPWRGAKPPPHPNVSAKPSTVPWSQRNRLSNEFPPPPPSDAEKTTDNLAPKRSNPQSRSFSTGYQTMPKPTIEKSSGSFGSSSPKMTRKNNDAPAALSTDTSPQKRVNSFLHTGPKLPGPKPHAANGPPLPPPSGVKPQKPNGVPRRLPIPEDKYYEPPPLKTSKPPNVVLPSKGRKKLSLPSLPGSLFSRPSLPSRDIRAPPPAGGRDLPAPPPSDARNHPPPPLGARDLPAPPPTGARDLPFPLPIGARDLPLPPPGGARGPHSPNLPPLPSRPIDLPPDLPSRPLPSPLPGKISMPLPVPPIEDDIYDDPVEALPPRPQMVPPPMVKRKSSGLIPTWSDEEDEAVYDETPDDPPARPLIPVGFPMPGAPPLIPEDGDEMYEDVEEYMRLKKIQLQQQQPTDGSGPGGKDKKEKDKKKKDSEKREKDIRKKFKLQAEGDVVPQGQGIVTETCKGSGKNLGVTKDERIDIVRMTDNPKGKWLIRNQQGEYGFVESDKVTIDVNQLRQTFGVRGMAPSGIAGGPPLPPGMIPPTSADDDDDDAIYDQTADEDIYEEV